MPALTLNTAIGLVNAEVAADGYEAGNGYPDGPWRHIIYQVAWAQSDAFIDALVPSMTYVGVPPGGTAIYKQPHYYNGNPNLACLNASKTPLGMAKPDGPTTSSGKLFASDLAIIRAEYRKPNWDADGSSINASFPGMNLPFSRVRRRTYTETEMMPESSLQVVGGAAGQKPPTKFPREYPVTEIVLTYSYFPYLYSSVLEGLVNRLNDSTFAGYGPEQVKFVGMTADPDTAAGDGSQTMTMEMTFQAKPWSWNTIPNPAGATRVKLSSDGTTGGVYPYLVADLTPCLISGSVA